MIFEDDNFESDEETTTYTNSLGIEITEIYEDGDLVSSGFQDPSWEHVVDEDDARVCCPYCNEELRYNGVDICCIWCDERFSEDRIRDEAGCEIHYE